MSLIRMSKLESGVRVALRFNNAFHHHEAGRLRYQPSYISYEPS